MRKDGGAAQLPAPTLWQLQDEVITLYSSALNEDPRLQPSFADRTVLLFIRYCSRDCQSKDWPFHKETCGIELDDEGCVIQKSKPPPSSQHSSSTPGYKVS